MSFDEARTQAEAALATGDARAAFHSIRFQLHYPSDLSDAQWVEAVRVFARAAAGVAGEEWAKVVWRVVETPDDVQALYDLGFELIEQSLHDVAAGVLGRANRLAPGVEAIVTELVVALEGAGQNGHAVEVLRGSPKLLAESPLCDYLLGINALMTTDLETPREVLGRVEKVRDDPNIVSMAGTLRQMVARADAVKNVSGLGEQDLRGWHFVVTGGVLLHLSPYGFDEGMNGRYAYTQDSAGRCLEGIRRVEAVLNAWDVRPGRVMLLPDRESAALGLAAARVMGVPAEEWDSSRADEATPALVVAYDLGRVGEDVLKALAEHRPGEVLWVHAAKWTEEPPFVGDLTTYLYQVNVSPWEEGLRASGETGKAEKRPGVAGSAEELAGQIVAAEVEEGAVNDLAALGALAGAVKEVRGEAAGGAFRRSGPRRRQRTDSPVKSSRFL